MVKINSNRMESTEKEEQEPGSSGPKRNNYAVIIGSMSNVKPESRDE